jgi:hypothetical protein
VRAYPAASLDAWCGKQRSSGFVGEPPDASALVLEDPSRATLPDTGRSEKRLDVNGRLRKFDSSSPTADSYPAEHIPLCCAEKQGVYEAIHLQTRHMTARWPADRRSTRTCPRVAAFLACYLYSHHVQDCLLSLKQTVRHLLEPRTRNLKRGL